MSHSTYEPEGVGRAVDPDPVSTYEAGSEVSPGTAYTEAPSTETLYAETYVAPTADLYAPLPESGTGSADGGTSVGDVKDTAADQGRRVADTAKESAGQVKDTAVEQGQKVAAVAKDEAVQVKNEAAGSLRDIVGQSRAELATQAGASQNRLAEYVHSLADELGTMASGSDASGPLTDLAHRGARTGGELSHWLSEHEPADLLADVTGFARRRPFAFLGASLLAGVVVGRVTRSLAAEAKDEHDAQQRADSTPAPALTGPDYAAPLGTPPAPVGYDAPYDQTYDQGTAVGYDTTGGYAPGYAAGLPENPAPQAWTGGTR